MTASHVKIGFLALCLAAVLALPSAWIARQAETPPHETNIAIEHEEPVTVRIVRLAATGASIVELSHNGSGTVAAHLPTWWTRQEVRGAPLSSVTSTPQEWNYVRWVIPAGATVRFDAPDADRVTVHNPSAVPLTIRTTVVRRGSTTREDDAVIVTVEPYTLP